MGHGPAGTDTSTFSVRLDPQENSVTTKAVILAAGVGSRLRPLTDARPKCLVELFGISLLDRQMGVLNACGIKDVHVVAGYRSEQLRARGYPVVINPAYESTNMVHTLFCARDLMTADADLLIAYGDIVYEARVLESILSCTASVCVAVDRAWRRYWAIRMDDPLADAETLKLDKQGYVTEIGKKPTGYDDIEGQYIGLIKVRADQVPRLVWEYDRMDRARRYDGKTFAQMFMTSFLQHLIDNGWPVRAVPIENGWLEVDTLLDLERYEALERIGELRRFYASGGGDGAHATN